MYIDIFFYKILANLHSLVGIIWLLLLRRLDDPLLIIVFMIQRCVEARVLWHAYAKLFEGSIVQN